MSRMEGVVICSLASVASLSQRILSSAGMDKLLIVKDES